MKKINKLIVITILLMISFVLGTSAISRVYAGDGYPNSLVENFCSQQGVSLWSPDIEPTYKTWYWCDLPYGI